MSRKNALDVGNHTTRVRVHFSTTKQVKSGNRNQTIDEILNDSLRLATTNIGKGTIRSEKPRPQASH